MGRAIIRTNRGFTIVELLIVIVVIAIIAAITIVAFRGVHSRAENSAVAVSTNAVAKKIELFSLGSGAYPSSITDCPTPSNTSLCIEPSDGTSYQYNQFAAGGSGYRIVLSDSYDLTVKTSGRLMYSSPAERTGGNEFMQYADLGPLIDQYGLKPYTLSFDLKSADTTNRNIITVYFQNGSTARYGGLSRALTVGTEYQRFEVTFTPNQNNMSVAQSWLAFYGAYGTGNRPIVKNLQFKVAQ